MAEENAEYRWAVYVGESLTNADEDPIIMVTDEDFRRGLHSMEDNAWMIFLAVLHDRQQ